MEAQYYNLSQSMDPIIEKMFAEFFEDGTLELRSESLGAARFERGPNIQGNTSWQLMHTASNTDFPEIASLNGITNFSNPEADKILSLWRGDAAATMPAINYFEYINNHPDFTPQMNMRQL